MSCAAAGLADPTPARFEWTYVPLPSGVAPEATIDIVPDNPSQMFEALFTFHANEPDVSLECRVDTNPYEPCGFESVGEMSRGGFEWGLEEEEVGWHTFQVRATDFEGNVGEPATNVELSLQRAAAVKEYLVGKGIDAGRIETRGAGPNEPVADNATDKGRQQNRRIEFKLLQK